MTESFRFSKTHQNWPLLSTQNLNVARFARNVEWYFFCDFQTLWWSLNYRMIWARCLMPKLLVRWWWDFTTRTFCPTTPSGQWRYLLHFKKPGCNGNVIIFRRFIARKREVANAWSPNWFFPVGPKWVYRWERTFYTLSRRFLRADNPVWPEENFYYKAGKKTNQNTFSFLSFFL